VVHFIGPMKPWHYEYDSETCQLKAMGTVSPHLLQLWWDIFLTFVNPRLTRYMPGLVGQLAMLQVLRALIIRPHRMYELLTIAIEDLVAWVSVCHANDCSYSFARWCHFDEAITTLL